MKVVIKNCWIKQKCINENIDLETKIILLHRRHQNPGKKIQQNG